MLEVQEFIGQRVILRSQGAGVVFGILRLISFDTPNLGVAIVDEARQIHYWEGGNTLFELSNKGCAIARISDPCENGYIIIGVCAVYLCTDAAIANLRRSRWNEA